MRPISPSPRITRVHHARKPDHDESSTNAVHTLSCAHNNKQTPFSISSPIPYVPQPRPPPSLQISHPIRKAQDRKTTVIIGARGFCFSHTNTSIGAKYKDMSATPRNFPTKIESSPKV